MDRDARSGDADTDARPKKGHCSQRRSGGHLRIIETWPLIGDTGERVPNDTEVVGATNACATARNAASTERSARVRAIVVVVVAVESRLLQP